MASASTPSSTDTSSMLKAYEDKINKQMSDAKAKLDQLDARAATQGAQAVSQAIAQLKTTRQNLEQKLRELRTTQESDSDRAKASIDAEVSKLQTSIDKLTAEFNAAMKK